MAQEEEHENAADEAEAEEADGKPQELAAVVSS